MTMILNRDMTNTIEEWPREYEQSLLFHGVPVPDNESFYTKVHHDNHEDDELTMMTVMMITMMTTIVMMMMMPVMTELNSILVPDKDETKVFKFSIRSCP